MSYNFSASTFPAFWVDHSREGHYHAILENGIVTFRPSGRVQRWGETPDSTWTAPLGEFLAHYSPAEES